MSQHDMNIANQAMGGGTSRGDVNNALAALASSSKGPTAPASPFAGQIWVDDDTPSATVWTVNMYDGTDWIAIGQLDTTANKFTATAGVRTDTTPSFTVAVNDAAYVDVASAGTCDIGAAASNNVRITGTTTITSLGSGAAGITRRVRFAGALTLTYNATSLILPTAASIVTAADDMAEFTSLGSGNWICTRYNRKSGLALAGASNLVQRVIATTSSLLSGSTAIPFDNTTPQNSEGDEHLTCTITPTSATNRLRIQVHFYVSANSSIECAMALFQDATANALAVAANSISSGLMREIHLVYEMAAGTTSATTFKIRIGSAASVTIYVNGQNGSARFNGKMISSIIIDEIVP